MPTIDDPAPGKYVKVRGAKKYDGQTVHGHYVGRIHEVKNDGNRLVLENGWHMHLDQGDELIWCADEPAPASVL